MNVKRLAVYIHDVAITGLAIVIALCLRVGVEEAFTTYEAVENAFIAAGLSALFLPMFSLNTGSWRYASIRDLISILKAATTIVAAFFVVKTVFAGDDVVPRSLYILSWIMTLMGLSAGRILYRVYKEFYTLKFRSAADWPHNPEAVLLLGFTDLSEQFIRANHRQKYPKYEIAGIIALAQLSAGRQIHGVKVLGTIDETTDILGELLKRGVAVARIVVADEGTNPADLDKLAEVAARAGLGISKLVHGLDRRADGSTPEVKPFHIEDLLGRKALDILDSETLAQINGKRMLVTGGGGSIGLELCRLIARMGPQKLVVADNCELNIHTAERDLRARYPELEFEICFCDVRDRAAVLRMMERHCPDLVIHAAALKHVEILQRNPSEGARTNVIGAMNVADAAEESGAKAALLISTDKAVKPSSVLGKTKRLAEFYFQHMDRQSRGTRFLAVRFGNVLGTTGSVVPIFREQIARGGPVTVTDPEVTRFFMAPAEASQLVLKTIAYGLAQAGWRGRVFVLNMGMSVKITDLASKLIVLAGRRPQHDVKIIFTGLKAGEKLHEELVDKNEHEEVTFDDAIVVAKSNAAPPRSAGLLFKELQQAIALGDDETTLEAIDRALDRLMNVQGDATGGAEIRVIKK